MVFIIMFILIYVSNFFEQKWNNYMLSRRHTKAISRAAKIANTPKDEMVDLTIKGKNDYIDFEFILAERVEDE